MEKRFLEALKEISSLSFELLHNKANIDKVVKIVSIITTANEALFFLVEDGHIVNIKDNEIISLEESILKEVINTKKGKIIPFAKNTPKFNPKVDNIYNFDVKHLMVIPILKDDRVVGVIEAFITDKAYHQFIEDDLKFLESLNDLFYAFIEVLTGDIVAKEVLFFKEMIHDIKNIINGVFAVLSFLKLENKDRTLNKYIELALQSSKLVSDLSYLLMNLGRDEVILREVHLVNELEPLFFLFCNNAQKKGIEYYTMLDVSTNCIVEFDVLKLKQILLNLVMNAIKFTEKGYVKVSLSVENDKLVGSVKDTGIGIEKEKIETIFAPFAQESSEIKKKYKGTGLGLHIVKRYIEALNGDIEVESEKGKGSEFRFWIPIKVKKRLPLSECKVALITKDVKDEFILYLKEFLENLFMDVKIYQKEPSELFDFAFYIDMDYKKRIAKKIVYIYKDKFSSKNYDYEVSECLARSGFLLSIIDDYEELEESIDFSGKSVLIVEDNRLNRELLEILLKKLGVKVYTATNGLEGLDILKKHDVDLIISDLEMPQIDGREFAASVKKILPNIPIIAFSAMKESDIKKVIEKYDFDDYLLKPILLDKLIEVLEKYLERK